MFNPVALRSPRLLGMVADFGRINKRMHNKSFTADGQASIVGGRNIGDEYFEAHAEMNFADLDVVLIGPVVKEVSDEFDLYWNNQSSIPMLRAGATEHDARAVRRKRAALSAYHRPRSVLPTRRACATVNLPGKSGAEAFPITGGGPRSWKTIRTRWPSSADKTETHLAPQLRDVVDKTKRELFLVSPYFVPGKKGVELLAERAPARRARGCDYQFAGFHRRGAGPLQISALPQAANRGRRRTL